MTPRSTDLDAAITAFIAHQRAFGRGYQHEAYVLDRFRRFVCDAGEERAHQNRSHETAVPRRTV